jgi:hypothetical protein
MTSANVEVIFSKNHVLLVQNAEIIAQGEKINNLFGYTALPFRDGESVSETVKYSSDITDLTLWHHRLGHGAVSTIEKMGKLQTAIGLPYINPNSTNYQCENFPFGKSQGNHSNRLKNYLSTSET